MKAFGRIAVVAAVLLLCFGLAGCKDSYKLTELLFDQESSVTLDMEDQLLVNVRDALNITQKLPALDMSEDVPETEDPNETPQLEGKDDIPDTTTVPQTEYNSYAESRGAPENSPTPTGEGNSSSGRSSSESSQEGDPSSGGDQDADDPGNGRRYKGKNGTGETYDPGGVWEELPTGVHYVVAFGEVANMVVSFAGEGALVGSDYDFLGNAFIQEAYADRGIAQVPVVWTDPATGDIDVDAVIACNPDALLLANNTYSLTSDQAAALQEAEIDVVYLPAMSSATGITKTADFIGQMLGGPLDTDSGKDAAGAAAEFIAWHDNTVNAQAQRHGGLVGTKNFNDGSTDGLGGSGVYTVYVDNWDFGATYTAMPGGGYVWSDPNGVAVSKVGWRWSPLSYYMQAGGAINNGALFKHSLYEVTHDYYVWQFNLGVVPTVYTENWNGRTLYTDPLENDGTMDLLVLGDGDQDIRLGSAAFPFVVTRTQDIANAFRASVDIATQVQSGVYALYSAGGFVAYDGTFADSYIASDFGIYANPHGLYSDWVYGSPESALESVWVSDLVLGTDDLPSALREYYSMFYGVELTDAQIEQIVAGAEY